MKKFLKIFLISFLTLLLISIICIAFGWQTKVFDFFSTPKVYISLDKVDSIKLKYKFSPKITINMKEEDYTFSFEIKDSEFIEEIKKEINNKIFYDYKGDLLLSIDNIYEVFIDDDTSFYFDHPREYVMLKNKGKKSMIAINKEITEKIAKILEEEYLKTVDIKDNFKTEELEIYAHKDKFINTYKINDYETVSDFLKMCNNLELTKIDKMDNNLKENIAYEIFLDEENYFFINENFSYSVFSAPQATVKSERTYYEIKQPENLKKFLENEYSNKKYEILECNIQNNIESKEINIGVFDGSTGENFKETKVVPAQNIDISVCEDSIDSNKIELTIRMENQSRFERALANDFKIYIRNDDVWEELLALSNSDENMINKYTNKVFENIDWTEKYGTLESGIYKLERNVKIDGYECSYYVIFEIK